MDLEEAKANIGKEVVFDENTKPYSNSTSILSSRCQDIKKGTILGIENKSVLIDVYAGYHMFVSPHHLKLKEQPMQNYKIKVTPETSEEVQKLFFELGYLWKNIRKTLINLENEYLYTDTHFKHITLGYVNTESNQEITLPQLRDLVVLKRNDVGDATHGAHFSYERFYISENCTKEYADGKWVDKVSKVMPIPLSELKEPFKEMTWQDAKKAIKEGKEVQVFVCEWDDIGDVFKNYKFRLKPQTIHIDGGDYTKEELLKIVGEME